MKKPVNGTEKINSLCKAVLKVTDEDIAEARGVAQQQAEYNSPFKMETVRWQGELADHNTRVLNALCALREVIRGGAKVQQP